MNPKSILLERKGHVAIVTINRPDRKNAFNESLFNELEAAAWELHAKPPRAVVITGAEGLPFCAGFDVSPGNPMLDKVLKAMSTHESEPAKQLIRTIRKAIDAFVSIPSPIIAALSGGAYGGGAELAVRCDLRVMDPKAVICFSEMRMGLMMDWGGGASLIRLIGPSKAADLILTARGIGASEAYALGLVNRVSEQGRALDEALSFAEAIADNGPRTVQGALTLIREYQNIPHSAMLDKEADIAATLLSFSEECLHGVGAFLEKRKPIFPDR